MLALLIWACVAGHQDDCHVYPIAQGFVSDDQCKAFKPLMEFGWLKLHEGQLELRTGTTSICVTNPEWFLGRFGA